VNAKGKRFVNESNSYHDIGMAIYAQSPDERAKHYFICDSDFVRKWGFGLIRPWPITIRISPFVKAGYVTRADTIAELASTIGIDSTALTETIARHNEFAKTGVDQDFHRGENAYNLMFGDPSAGLNPNLRPIQKPPFYALRIRQATMGTTIGLKGSVDGEVLDRYGVPIPGLFSCGNDIASVFRGFYPGGGSTLGPAVVMAYRAVERMMAIKAAALSPAQGVRLRL
jgi:3-oxosteroid 1-dehydrogenase